MRPAPLAPQGLLVRFKLNDCLQLLGLFNLCSGTRLLCRTVFLEVLLTFPLSPPEVTHSKNKTKGKKKNDGHFWGGPQLCCVSLDIVRVCVCVARKEKKRLELCIRARRCRCESAGEHVHVTMTTVFFIYDPHLRPGCRFVEKRREVRQEGWGKGGERKKSNRAIPR